MTSAELKYLTAINELYDGTKGIKLPSIDAKMNVTKVSVYKALERLENHEYIKRDERNKVIMTEYCYEQLDKYKVLVCWFSNQLQSNYKIPAEIAYNDAIGAISAFSDETKQVMADLIERDNEKINGSCI